MNRIDPGTKGTFRHQRKERGADENRQKDFSQCGSQIALRVEEGKTGHAVAHRFPLHASCMQHRAGLVEVETGFGTPKRVARRAPEAGHRRHSEDEDLGRRITRRAQGHEELHRRRRVFRARGSYEQVFQTQVECKELHRSRAGRCERLLVAPDLGEEVP